MKIRPKIIAPSQKNPHSIHGSGNGCNGTPKSSKLLNCTGTPLRSPAIASEGCFGRITVCEINCSHNNNNNSNNHCCTTTAANGSLHSFGMGNGNGNTVYTTNHANSSGSSSYTATTNSNSSSSSSITITKNANSNTDKTNHIYAYALISFIAVMVYLNGINGDFVHDDIPAITLNKDVIGINKITRSFFNDFWGTPMDDANSHKSYRPLTVLSFR